MGHQESDERARPVLLEPTNFTPPQRTPWGGRRIRALKGIGRGDVVGESWELSVEPSFPSVAIDGRRLDEVVGADPRGWLGADAQSGATALLVKLLDAADELSVQIHPSDAHPGLAPDESGKPESWYVVEREPGAGLYLGLSAGADRQAMARALDEGGDVSALLTFVEVEPGDFLVIEAGTPHCIGRGVLLVEPQRVLPGRRGVTYRYWDWGRRYDADGRRDPSGRPRALHRDEALAVTGWDRPRGEALLERIRHRAGPPAPSDPARLDRLAGPDGAIASDALWVARLHGTGGVELPGWNALCALTVLSGRVELGGVSVEQGRTCAVPASFDGPVVLDAAHAILSAAREGD